VTYNYKGPTASASKASAIQHKHGSSERRIKDLFVLIFFRVTNLAAVVHWVRLRIDVVFRITVFAAFTIRSWFSFKNCLRKTHIIARLSKHYFLIFLLFLNLY